MRVLLILSIFFLFFGLFLFLYVKVFQRKNTLVLERPKKNPSIAIIIPARDESMVIEDLLISIEKQTKKINPSHVYVIVEDEFDLTVQITKKHHMEYFVRRKLNLKTKGYAIAELIEDLDSKKKYYDCYFIFDADNVLEENFIEEMMGDYQKGYAVSTGYRALKNKDSYFPFSAGLTFFLINEIRNRLSLKNDGNLILSGTGYYIHGKYIKEWKTFPFHSLTEDYESSLYFTLNGISTHYNENACFYDEQPETYQESLKQRSRWIKGYFTNFLAYQSLFREKKQQKPHNLGSVIEMQIGILPVLFIVLGLVLLLLVSFFTIFSTLRYESMIFFLLLLLEIYLSLVLITDILLWMALKKMDFSKKVFWQVLFYHPIFLISYIHAFFIAFLKKDLGWEKIKRTKRVKK